MKLNLQNTALWIVTIIIVVPMTSAAVGKDRLISGLPRHVRRLRDGFVQKQRGPPMFELHNDDIRWRGANDGPTTDTFRQRLRCWMEFVAHILENEKFPDEYVCKEIQRKFSIKSNVLPFTDRPMYSSVYNCFAKLQGRFIEMLRKNELEWLEMTHQPRINIGSLFSVAKPASCTIGMDQIVMEEDKTGAA